MYLVCKFNSVRALKTLHDNQEKVCSSTSIVLIGRFQFSVGIDDGRAKRILTRGDCEQISLIPRERSAGLGQWLLHQSVVGLTRPGVLRAVWLIVHLGMDCGRPGPSVFEPRRDGLVSSKRRVPHICNDVLLFADCLGEIGQIKQATKNNPVKAVTHIYARARTHGRTDERTHARTHEHIHTHTYTHTQIHTHTRTHTHIHCDKATKTQKEKEKNTNNIKTHKQTKHADHTVKHRKILSLLSG